MLWGNYGGSGVSPDIMPATADSLKFAGYRFGGAGVSTALESPLHFPTCRRLPQHNGGNRNPFFFRKEEATGEAVFAARISGGVLSLYPCRRGYAGYNWKTRGGGGMCPLTLMRRRRRRDHLRFDKTFPQNNAKSREHNY